MAGTTTLLTLLVLATSVWVGGYVAIAVVARTATRTLDPYTRVVFFRDLGRRYFWVGTPALVVALIAGGLLVRDAERGALLTTTVGVTALLVAAFAIAVLQARRMTRLRLRVADAPEDPSLQERARRGAISAGLLRAVLGVLSVVVVVLGSCLGARG